MTKPVIYTTSDVGCHADGTFGADHIRTTLAELIRSTAEVDGVKEAVYLKNLADELLGEPPDDFSDECDALEALQNYTEPHITWELYNGDLMLSKCE